LVAAGTIRSEQSVVAVLTGNLLKDPTNTVAYHTGEWPDAAYANPPLPVAAELGAVRKIIEGTVDSRR
jgi:enoyl reductase-like protein